MDNNKTTESMFVDTTARARLPYNKDRSDAVLALIMLPLSYLFARWVLFSWSGWGTAAFTALYLVAVTAYFRVKGAKPCNGSWFWACALLATGLSCGLWAGRGMLGTRGLFLFALAVYYPVSAGGALIGGRTGNALPADALNAAFIIPFRNFGNQYNSFSALRRTDGENPKKGRVGAILLGAALALIILVVVVPLLTRADSGGFSALGDALSSFFRLEDLGIHVFVFVSCAIPAIPIGLYMFGLLSGVAHKRATEQFDEEQLRDSGTRARIIPQATALIVLGAVLVVYAVFIVCQLPYFFSAFGGTRPFGTISYSDYARNGFFELCTIAGINLALLALGNLFTRRADGKPALKVVSIALSCVTILLLATAFSKMALYVRVFGLTMLRLLPCVFMAFLLLVFAGFIVLQFKRFSLVRLAAVAACAILVLLCAVNPDALVVRYNTDRYVAGTLADYDVDILYRAGAAGVRPAINMLARSNIDLPNAARAEVQAYLDYMKSDLFHAHSTGSMRYLTLEESLAERQLLRVTPR
jgi:hypothetical protein